MTAPDFLDPRLTEQRNPGTERIDVAAALEMCVLINTEDATVPGAVRAVRAEIARAIDLVVDALRQGGRLIYVGAGTSGRLGVLDASECPPTFGTPPEMVVGVIAGGHAALGKSSQGAEDDVNAGMEAIDRARAAARHFVLATAGRRAIDAAAGSVKLAIVMVKRGVGKDEAGRLLEQAGGFVRRAVGDPPPVTDVIR